MYVRVLKADMMNAMWNISSVSICWCSFLVCQGHNCFIMSFYRGFNLNRCERLSLISGEYSSFLSNNTKRLSWICCIESFYFPENLMLHFRDFSTLWQRCSLPPPLPMCLYASLWWLYTPSRAPISLGPYRQLESKMNHEALPLVNQRPYTKLGNSC